MTRCRLSLSGALLLLGSSLAGVPAQAETASDGRALFQGIEPFQAGLATTNRNLPTGFAACVNCHGVDGAGKGEGGVLAPAIDRASLGKFRGLLPPLTSENAIMAAVETGIGRDGRPLGSVMPRYRLATAERAALLAYLGRVGTSEDVPPGVSAQLVRFGALLPLSGPRGRQGRAVQAGIERTFAAANRAGGVHGRHLSLVVEDTAEGVRAASDRLLQRDIYAIVGGIWDAADAGLETRLADARISVVASLVVRQDGPAGNPWISDLLASRTDQAKRLERALVACRTSGPRWRLGVDRTATDSDDAVIAVTDAAVAQLTDAEPAGCLGYDLGRLNAVGGAAVGRWQRRIALPFPVAVLQAAGSDIWGLLGVASARIALEALAVAGASLHEKSLIEALPQLNGFQPIADAPVVYFNRNRTAWDPGILALEPEPVTDAIGRNRGNSSLAAAIKEEDRNGQQQP